MPEEQDIPKKMQEEEAIAETTISDPTNPLLWPLKSAETGMRYFLYGRK
jgi:hypothetical protein